MTGAHRGLFPYPPRPIQSSIMDAIGGALARKGHVVIEAGTGAGKTVASLVPVLEHAVSSGARILYLTRTNSQQVQVIKEFRSISRHAGPCPERPDHEVDGPEMVDEILAELNGKIEARPSVEGSDGPGPPIGLCVPLQGRANMCPLASDDPELMVGTPEELSRLCSERKRNTLSRMSGKPISGPECPYYAAFLLDEGREIREWAMREIPTAEEISERCGACGICPYETVKAMLGTARVVCAPYIFFFYPFIRKNLLEWMGCSLEDLVVIVDEAHNLAQFVRDIGSMSLSTVSIRHALSEVEVFGDHRVSDRHTITGFLMALQRSIGNIAGEHLVDEDGLVPPSALSEEMMIAMSSNSAKVGSVAAEVAQHGEAIREAKKAQGKLPRSYIHLCATFYQAWNGLEFERYTPLIVKGRRDEISLEAFAMDPSVMTGILEKVRASIHLSGTLSPLEEYRDSIGLPEDTALVKLPPPFPLSNRMVVYDTDLSTNHERMMRDPGMVDRIRERILYLLEGVKGRNVAVFFPSFDLMRAVLGEEELEDGDTMPGSVEAGRPLFIERRGCSQSEVMELVSDFKATRGGALFSVVGGRLSEGMDYPGESLEVVVIVGIPYPRPNARQRAICAYYDVRFRKGWEYTVHAPASRRILQAMGRMIRSETDRGVGFIMDSRAIHFREQLPDLRAASGDAAEVAAFFS
jgi:DNA excision repair protein ERCC-2